MSFIQKIYQVNNLFNQLKRIDQNLEEGAILNAQLLTRDLKDRKIASFSEIEFKVFSQWGDDGIIQWLVNNIKVSKKSFVEFGVENYRESNTRFLLMNNNWTGFVLDGSSKNIREIINSYYYWRFNLTAKEAFVNTENINNLISAWDPSKELGLLHIDIDGNDYWVWNALTVTHPEIVIMEYNSIFGKERAITIPYQKDFTRTKAHYSNLYFGASIKALCMLAEKKGYNFIGCNSAGNNAYFVLKELTNDLIKGISVEEGFVESQFRESRDKKNNLTFLGREESLRLIKGLPVYDLNQEKIVEL